MKKKAFSLLVALVMALSMFPTLGQAAGTPLNLLEPGPETALPYVRESENEAEESALLFDVPPEASVQAGIFQPSQYLYYEVDGKREIAAEFTQFYQAINGETPIPRTYLYTMVTPELSPDGTYYLSVSSLTPEGTPANGANVLHATVGLQGTLDDFKNAPEIKDQLLSDASQPGGGYPVTFNDFEDGAIILTFETILGEFNYWRFRTEEYSEPVDPKDTVFYNLGAHEFQVGASKRPFEADGSYVIELEDDPFFPYEVQFTVPGQEPETRLFHTDDDGNVIPVTFAGHTFYAKYTGTPRSVTFWVRGSDGRHLKKHDAYYYKTFLNGDIASGVLPTRQLDLFVSLTEHIWSELNTVHVTVLPENQNLWMATKSGAAEDEYFQFESGETFNLNSPAIETHLLDEESFHIGSLEIRAASGNLSDKNSSHYHIRMAYFKPEAMLQFEIYREKDNVRTKVPVSRTEFYRFLDYGSEYLRCDTYVLSHEDKFATDETILIGMRFAQEFTPYDFEAVTVYEGDYNSVEEALQAGAKDITDKIWMSSPDEIETEGGYPFLLFDATYQTLPGFTCVFQRKDGSLEVTPFALGIWLQEYASLSPAHNEIYAGTADYRELAGNWTDTEFAEIQDPNTDDTFIFQMYSTRYPTNGKYYVELDAVSTAQKDTEYMVVITPEEYEANKEYYDQFPEIYYVDKSSTLIVRSALGRFTAEELAAQPDISEQLFSDARASGGGYLADFANGPVTFTILDSLGSLHYITLKLEAAPEGTENLPVIPASNPGTSFEVYNFYGETSETGTRNYPTRTHTVTANEDSYFRNGYQTIFQDSANPVADGSTIFPVFSAGDSIVIYAGMNQHSGIPQKSNETPVKNFVSGKPIRYSTAVKDGEHMNNYWVTFVTPVKDRAQLFVNAASNIDDFHRDENGMPVREVLLTQYYNYRHDILIANIGEKQLDGIRVKLAGNPDGTGEAVNVEFDELYSIGVNESASLEPFPMWNTNWPNLAKIRLRAKTVNGEVQNGDIEGYLIITTENGGNMTVKLTGVVGEPRIITETLNPVEGKDYHAVKYVHYSTFLQTSSMYASDKPSFKVISGTLPKGVNGQNLDVTLNPNGELYGVPEQIGDFTFTVRATFYGDESVYDEKTYTLRVVENTDENVNYGTGISDYPLLQSKPGDYNPAVEYDPDSGDLIIHSRAEYPLFVGRLTLDGKELTPGEEYVAGDGSLIATIRSQAVRSAGTGATHTISAENRAGGSSNTNTTLTRTSVNVPVKSSGGGSGSGGGNSSSSGGGGSSGGGSSGGGTAARSNSRKYNITVSSASNGTLTVNPSTAAKGEKVTITAKPNSGYQVRKVSVSGNINVSGSGNAYTFTMPAKNVTVSAEFAPIAYTVTTASVSNGTLQTSVKSATRGTTVSVTVAPNKGYEIRSVSASANGNAVSLSGSEGRYTFVMPSGNVTVRAEFAVKRLAAFGDIQGTDWFFDDAVWG